MLENSDPGSIHLFTFSVSTTRLLSASGARGKENACTSTCTHVNTHTNTQLLLLADNFIPYFTERIRAIGEISQVPTPLINQLEQTALLPSSVFLIRHIFLLIQDPMLPLIIVPLNFYYITPSLILSKQHLNRLKSLLCYNKQTKFPPPYIPLYVPSSSLLLQSPGFKTDSISALLIYF